MKGRDKMNEIEKMKKEVTGFVDSFIAKLPYFYPKEVILECSECQKPLYETNRESIHLEILKPHDFQPIHPQQEIATYEVTCIHCQKTMKPYINYVCEGHKRD